MSGNYRTIKQPLSHVQFTLRVESEVIFVTISFLAFLGNGEENNLKILMCRCCWAGVNELRCSLNDFPLLADDFMLESIKSCDFFLVASSSPTPEAIKQNESCF